MIVNELRSESVHEEFMEVFGQHFSIRKVPHAQMHPVYQHPALHIFILKKKMQPASTTNQKEVLPAASTLEQPRTALPQHNAGKEGESAR